MPVNKRATVVSRVPFLAAVVAAAGLCVAALVAPLPAIATPSPCDPVTDAMRKSLDTNVHSYSTSTSDARPGIATKIEGIQADGIAYALMGGQWIKSPMTIASMKTQVEDVLKNQKPVCQYLHDEDLDGQPAAVYSEKTALGKMTADATVFISKASGLPLKQDVFSDVGGAKGKRHTVTTYTYTGVTAPPTVN
jgi:hypothetical protein